MMWWYGPGMGGWGYALMGISTVLFWGLIIFGVVVLVRYLGRSGTRPEGRAEPPRPSPEDLLAERFARGEIDTEEYRRRLEELRAARPYAKH